MSIVPIAQKTTSSSIGPVEWKVYDPKDVGLTLVTLDDPVSQISLAQAFANPNQRYTSLDAWTAARHSRSPHPTPEILREIVTNNTDFDTILGKTFRDYNHQSVYDQARFMIHFNNVPMHIAQLLFTMGAINGGQEKSSRYQLFGDNPLQPLADFDPKLASFEQRHQQLGKNLQEAIKEMHQPLTGVYTDHFQPKKEYGKTSLKTRVIDTTREMVLWGQRTGFCYETSARGWARTVCQLLASPMEPYRRLGKQLSEFLGPDPELEKELAFKASVPAVQRYMKPHGVAEDNFKELEQYLKNTDFEQLVQVQRELQGEQPLSVDTIPLAHTPGERMAAQYVMTLFPGAHHNEVYNWVSTLPQEKKRDLANIISNNHDTIQELPMQQARVTNLSTVIIGGEPKDLVRHRSAGRFWQGTPFHPGAEVTYDRAKQILGMGYVLPVYLEKNGPFEEFGTQMKEVLDQHYADTLQLLEDVHTAHGDSINYGFIVAQLPLAHATALHMHFDPKSARFFTEQRTRTSGHINYRVAAYNVGKGLEQLDPFLNLTDGIEKPDPFHRIQFLDRK